MPSASDAHTLQALFEGVDAARAEAELIWGVGRLPLLVDDQMRAKVHSQTAKWSVAYAEAWDANAVTKTQLDAVEAAAGGMRRMWAKLAELASEAGHRPLNPTVWETQLADGSVAAIVQTHTDAAHVIAQGRHVNVYALEEIAHIIDALPPALAMAKVVFPGAKFQAAGDRSWVKRGDEIPFGDAA